MLKMKMFVGVLGATLALSLSSFAYENVDAKKFKEILKKNKNVVLLDVRTPQEFYEGHIPEANLLPVQLFQYVFLGGKGIKDKTVLVYCRSGKRSSIAAKQLDEWGVKKVYNLKGGIIEWKSSGFKVIKPEAKDDIKR